MLTGTAIKTEMNKNLSVNSQGLVGKRLEEAQGTPLEDLPNVVIRLIEDCCHADPGHRIKDMPTLAERLTLARMTVKKKRPGPDKDTDDGDASSGAWLDDGEANDADQSDATADASD